MIHPRVALTDRARFAIREAIEKACEKLTEAERHRVIVQVFTDELVTDAKWDVKIERHGKNAKNKGADEA